MKAFDWVRNATSSSSEYICETRDVAEARIEKLRTSLLSAGWSEDKTSLISAVIGELAGNCFDHNLGKWKDAVGCWLEATMNDDHLTIIVADRGQGVLPSLRQVLPNLEDSVEALRVAFTQVITGRAPEQRGNGLKFVIRSLQHFLPEYFAFVSGSARLELKNPIDTSDISAYITEIDEVVKGTYAEMKMQK